MNKSSKPRVILHIDMDAFFAAVEVRDNPALVGKPVIIGADPQDGKGRGVVSTCSYEARKFGVRSAMPISTAYRLCPNAIYLRGNYEKYKTASLAMLNILEEFTPDIEPISIDEAFLDITQSYHLHQSPKATAQKIKERIWDNIQLTASIGIAPNKMIAKIASDCCKPNGILEIKPEGIFDFLWPLPVERLWGVGKQTQGKLKTIGIFKIGDIAKTSRQYLVESFGKHGAHLFNLANGIDDRTVCVDDEVKSLSNEHTFERDTSDETEIYQTISFLSEKVSRRLRKEGLKGKTISVKIRTSDFHTVTRATTLGIRINFYDTIHNAARDLFSDFYLPDMKIRLIGVRVTNFDDPYVADDLFEDEESIQKENIHRAVDDIKNKFGEKAIVRGGVVKPRESINENLEQKPTQKY